MFLMLGIHCAVVIFKFPHSYYCNVIILSISLRKRKCCVKKDGGMSSLKMRPKHNRKKTLLYCFSRHSVQSENNGGWSLTHMLYEVSHLKVAHYLLLIHMTLNKKAKRLKSMKGKA